MLRSKVLPLLMSWTCSKCTFINPSSQKSVCKICLSTQSSSSSSSSFSPSLQLPKWACKACTFLNHYDNTSCEVCANTSSASLLSALADDDDELEALESSVGDVFFPLKGCTSNKNKNKRKMDEDYQPDASTEFRGSKSTKREPEPMGRFLSLLLRSRQFLL